MKKFLGSGGLGDMLITYSKCFNYVDKDEKFHFTYIDNKDNRRTNVDYPKYAREFLSTQNIYFDIKTENQIEYYKNHAKEYDYCFSPQVYGKTHDFLKRPNSIESDSKPYINFIQNQTHLSNNVKGPISIVSFAGNGDDSRRTWSSYEFLQNLIKYINVKLNRNVILIGIKENNTFTNCNDLRNTDFITELKGVVASDTIICFSGFIHLFSCFMNKQVIVKWENEAAKNFYFHPDWLKNNVKFWYNESYSEIINLL